MAFCCLMRFDRRQALRARRANAARDKTVPVLQFKDRTQHILLPTGQHLRKDPKPMSKKERRRQKRLSAPPA